MHIAVDARVLSLPEARGIAGYVMELLRHWPEDGDSFCLFTEQPIEPERYASPVPVHTVQVPSVRGSRFRVWDWYCLPKAVKKAHQVRPFDLLWTPANVTIPFAGLPQVTTIHDTIVQECMQINTLFERWLFRSVYPWWTRRYGTKVATVSRFSRERISAVYGYPSERIRVILNGATFVQAPFASADEAFTFLKQKELVQKPYLLVFGAESSWKNTAGAISTFARIARKNKDIHLVIAGLQQRSMEHFAMLAAASGVQERITLLPFTERRVRDALYQAATIFLYPSLFEGFGLPPLEAMAIDTPVIASNAASIPEVTGKAALLVDATDAGAMAEAVLNLLDNAALKQTLIEAGRENISRFTWSDAARQHKALFAEVIQ